MATSFPLAIYEKAPAWGCLGAMVLGAFAACVLVFLSANSQRHSLNIKQLCIIPAVLTAISACLFVFCLQGAQPFVTTGCVIAYGFTGVALGFSFICWIQVFLRQKPLHVLTLVAFCSAISGIINCFVIPLENPLAACIVVMCLLLAGSCLLLFCNFSTQDSAQQPHQPEEHSHFVYHVLRAISFPLIGFALVFLDYGIRALPVLDNPALTIHHPEIALIGRLLLAGTVITLVVFVGEARLSSPKYLMALLPVFAVLLACFTFVRLFAPGEPFKNIISVMGTAALSGFLAAIMMFLTWELQGQKDSDSLKCSSATLGLAFLAYPLGMLLFTLAGDYAFDIEMLLIFVYVAILAVITMVQAVPQPSSGVSIEDRCSAIAQEHDLSDREAEVFGLLAKNMSVEDIAEKLFISTGTVQAHKKRIYAKLGVHKHAELLGLVYQTDKYN